MSIDGNNNNSGSVIGELRLRPSSSPTSARLSSLSPSLPCGKESHIVRSAITSSMTLGCNDGDEDKFHCRQSRQTIHYHHQNQQRQQLSPHRFLSKPRKDRNNKKIQKLSTILFLTSLATCLLFVAQIHSRAIKASSASLLFGRANHVRRPSFERDAPSSLDGRSTGRYEDGNGDAILKQNMIITQSSRRMVHLSEYHFHFQQNAREAQEAGRVTKWRNDHDPIGLRQLLCQLQTAISFFSRWTTASNANPTTGGRIIDDPMLYNTDRVADDQIVINDVNSESMQDESEREQGGDESMGNGDNKQCVPMADWQTTSYPNCNSIHEIDLILSSGSGSRTFSSIHPTRRQISPFPRQLKRLIKRLPKDKSLRKRKHNLNAKGIMVEDNVTFLGQGWFRSAWKVDGMGVYEGEELERGYAYGEDDDREGIEGVTFDEAVVLKTLRIERDFLEEYYELHRRDALAMERLTFSPYVMNIYGYCGQSAINELANFGIEGLSSLEKISRQFRGLVKIEPVSKIKLQLAAMVSTGVSHVHSIDYPDHIENSAMEAGRKSGSNATMVHYDLNPRNIAIIERGRPKLNDFNVAEFMMWNPKTKRPCGFKGRFREPWWRAPEEMHYHQSGYEPKPLTEKVDIYALGNILFNILTTHSPRGKMTSDLQDGVRPKVARGELPVLPMEFETTKDPALVAIRAAMYKCLRAKPEDRPTAGEIAEELNRAIDNLPEGYGDREKFYQSIGKGSHGGQRKKTKR